MPLSQRRARGYKPTEPIKMFSFLAKAGSFRDEPQASSPAAGAILSRNRRPVPIDLDVKTQCLRCCRAAKAQHLPFPVAQA